MNKPIFLPTQLESALKELHLSDYKLSREHPDSAIYHELGRYICSTDPHNNGVVGLDIYRKVLLDWWESLDHYFSGPDLEKHPNYHTYTLGWVMRNPHLYPSGYNQVGLPKEIIHLLNEPTGSGTTNASYTQVEPSYCLIWIKPGSTIEDALATLTEWERIAALVAEHYEESPEEGVDIWEQMDLSGDDDVDYQSSYLSSVIEFFRAYLFLKTKDARFINS